MPGDTLQARRHRQREHRRSTKAGSLCPATPMTARLARGCGFALNEGREFMPGDTPSRDHRLPSASSAQRRPGVYARRHLPLRDHLRGQTVRSTKAGSLCPATPEVPGGGMSTAGHAQRRPGVYARRHSPRGRVRASDVARSTKAGSLCPATPGNWVPSPSSVISAQRRPGVYARRHLPETAWIRGRTRRSTKAGSLCPATLARGAVAAEPSADAQRRPGVYARRHTMTARLARDCCFALNEGREFMPGDTGCSRNSPTA